MLAARVHQCRSALKQLVLGSALVICSSVIGCKQTEVAPSAVSMAIDPSASYTASFEEICPGAPVPTGWITISSRACAGCCGSTGIVQMRTIQKIDTMPSGSTLEICPGQPTPAGWIIISSRACAGCCGASGIVQMPTIKKIDGLALGTVLEICPGQPTPAGWTVISTRACAGCCGASGIVQMPTIKRLS